MGWPTLTGDAGEVAGLEIFSAGLDAFFHSTNLRPSRSWLLPWEGPTRLLWCLRKSHCYSGIYLCNRWAWQCPCWVCLWEGEGCSPQWTHHSTPWVMCCGAGCRDGRYGSRSSEDQPFWYRVPHGQSSGVRLHLQWGEAVLHLRSKPSWKNQAVILSKPVDSCSYCRKFGRPRYQILGPERPQGQHLDQGSSLSQSGPDYSPQGLAIQPGNSQRWPRN